MTLTFSCSEQPSHPLMCDLWSILLVVNLGWQRVVPCWGVGVNNQPRDRSLGTHLEIKRWSEIQTESRHAWNNTTRAALHIPWWNGLRHERRANNRSTVLRHSRTPWPNIWSASRASSQLCKWAYLELFIVTPGERMGSNSKITTAARSAKVQIYNPLTAFTQKMEGLHEGPKSRKQKRACKSRRNWRWGCNSAERMNWGTASEF